MAQLRLAIATSLRAAVSMEGMSELAAPMNFFLISMEESGVDERVIVMYSDQMVRVREALVHLQKYYKKSKTF
jgi:hypothetical protein